MLSAAAEPSGPVTREAFDHFAGLIVAAAAEEKAELDGILLGLHGAMVTDFCEDGEGELLERLRAVVGPDLPIAITLDLHANVTPKMCALANIVVSYKTYPHVDMRDIGPPCRRDPAADHGRRDPPEDPAGPSPDAGRGQWRPHRCRADDRPDRRALDL